MLPQSIDTLWQYASLKMTHYWVRHICQFHQNLIEAIKAMSLPGVSVTVAKCNHLAAQFCGPYPVCLVLAANALFMSTLLRVPYGVVVGSRCWLASGLPLSGAGSIGWAGLNAAHGVTTGCLRRPASGCADVDRDWDDRAIYGGEVLTWIPWTRNL